MEKAISGYSLRIDWIKTELYKAIERCVNDDEILNGKEPPTLRKGDEVEVIVNAKNLTFHKGVIYDRIWHYKEKKWFYYICENDKKVAKRYCDIDLRLIKKANDKEDIV